MTRTLARPSIKGFPDECRHTDEHEQSILRGLAPGRGSRESRSPTAGWAGGPARLRSLEDEARSPDRPRDPTHDRRSGPSEVVVTLQDLNPPEACVPDR